MNVSGINTNISMQSANLDMKINAATEKDFESVFENLTSNGKESNEEIAKACKEMETYFISSLFKEMRKTVPDSGFVKKNQGEKIFTEMLDQESAKSMTEVGGIGIANMMYEQLKH